MIQIRLSASSREELETAMQAITEKFILCRKKCPDQSKNGRYKAYLLVTENKKMLKNRVARNSSIWYNKNNKQI